MKLRARAKQIVSFILFLAIALLLFVEVTWLFRANYPKDRLALVNYKNRTDFDVVLYGGSNVFTFFQPLEAWDKQGFTSYNYASASAPLDLLKYFIEDSRTTNQAKLYVVDLRSLSITNETVDESGLRNWSDSLPLFSIERIKGITSYLSRRNLLNADAVSYYLDIAKYHSQYTQYKKPSHWIYLNRRSIDDPRMGFREDNRHHPFARPELTDERGEVSDFYLDILNELLDYCDREKLPVLFTVCPYVISKEECEIFNTCGDIVRARGYDFLNLNEHYDDIGLDFDTDYSSVNHVNFLGAEKYTKYLMNYLSSHYDLPDHRGDAAYADWNTAYANYTKIQQELRDEITAARDQHMEARAIGERLPEIEDPAAWLNLIRNENYTVLLLKNQQPAAEIKDPAQRWIYDRMLSDWDIDPSQPHSIGIWSAGNCIFAKNDSASYDGELGVAGQGLVPIHLEAGDAPQLRIGDVDYCNGTEGLWIAVFDNNDLSVVDCVRVCADESGLRLVR